MTYNNIVYLEVDKSNLAIMSYYLNQPSNTSQFEYVAATTEELTILNAIEDNLLAPGMIVTISDLYAHRTRVQAARDKAAKPAAKTPQRPSECASVPTPSTSDVRRSASLKAAIKQHRNRK